MSIDRTESAEAQHDAYEAPRIELLGDLNELTKQMISGPNADMGGFMAMGMS